MTHKHTYERLAQGITNYNIARHPQEPVVQVSCQSQPRDRT